MKKVVELPAIILILSRETGDLILVNNSLNFMDLFIETFLTSLKPATIYLELWLWWWCWEKVFRNSYNIHLQWKHLPPPFLSVFHVHSLKFSYWKKKKKHPAENRKFKSHAIYHTCFYRLLVKQKNIRAKGELICEKGCTYAHSWRVFGSYVCLTSTIIFPLELCHKYKQSCHY
jgi:hypothetical protein